MGGKRPWRGRHIAGESESGLSCALSKNENPSRFRKGLHQILRLDLELADVGKGPNVSDVVEIVPGVVKADAVIW